MLFGLETDCQVREVAARLRVHVGHDKSQLGASRYVGALGRYVLSLKFARVDEEVALIGDVGLAVESEFHVAVDRPLQEFFALLVEVRSETVVAVSDWVEVAVHLHLQTTSTLFPLLLLHRRVPTLLSHHPRVTLSFEHIQLLRLESKPHFLVPRIAEASAD